MHYSASELHDLAPSHQPSRSSCRVTKVRQTHVAVNTGMHAIDQLLQLYTQHRSLILVICRLDIVAKTEGQLQARPCVIGVEAVF
jgi:hypothetical protein